MDAPSVYDYQDPAAFLRERFNHLNAQAAEKGFSIRQWAHEMGLKEPKVLAEILSGKRKASLKHLDWLSGGLSLSEDEGFYLQLLIQREQAATALEKQPFDLLLAQLKPVRENRRIYFDDGDLFLDWLDMAIYAFCKLRGASLQRSLIHQAFRVRADETRIDAALERLLSSGLIQEGPGGELEGLDVEVTTTADLPIRKVHNYYRQVFELAKDAIETSVEEREFQCFSVAIDSRRIPQIKRMLRSLRKEIFSLSDASVDQVFQVNLQAFPLTERVNAQTKFDDSRASSSLDDKALD